MPSCRQDATAAARKLLRTLASAPEPRKRAREIYLELAGARDWSASERDEIQMFGDWLQSYPATDQLRLGCEKIIASLT